MSTPAISVDDDWESRFQSGSGVSGTTVRLADCADAAVIEDAARIAGSAIASHQATSMQTPLDGRVTVGAPGVLLPEETAHLETQIGRLEGIQDQLINEGGELKFPNLAWEAVKAGLAEERKSSATLRHQVQEAEKFQKDIDLLLDLNAELTAHKDGFKEMPASMKGLLEQLKDRGIDIWKGELNGFSKETIAELKLLTSSQVDKVQSNLRIIFTTRIQSLITAISAILDTLREIIRNDRQAKAAANRLPGH